MNTNKQGGKGYTKNPRARKLDGFLQRYGMEMKEWVKWKKEHTKEEVVAKRARARELIGKINHNSNGRRK